MKTNDKKTLYVFAQNLARQCDNEVTNIDFEDLNDYINRSLDEGYTIETYDIVKVVDEDCNEDFEDVEREPENYTIINAATGDEAVTAEELREIRKTGEGSIILGDWHIWTARRDELNDKEIQAIAKANY